MAPCAVMRSDAGWMKRSSSVRTKAGRASSGTRPASFRIEDSGKTSSHPAVKRGCSHLRPPRGERGPTVSRTLRCIVAFGVAWSLQAGVSFAESDWLDRASGPGPFKGLFFHYRFLCVSKGEPQTAQAIQKGDIHLQGLTPFDRTASALHLVGALFDKQPVDLNNAEKETACKSDNRFVRGYFEIVYNRMASVSNDLVEGGPQVHILSYEAAYVSRVSH